MKNKQQSLITKLRAIRDKISLEIKDMNKEEIKNYFKRKKSLFPESKWKNASSKLSQYFYICNSDIHLQVKTQNRESNRAPETTNATIKSTNYPLNNFSMTGAKC